MTTLDLSTYQIVIGGIEDIQAKLNAVLRGSSWSRVYVLVDENTERDCWPLLISALWPRSTELIRIPSGEVHKSIKTCEKIWDHLVQSGADRLSLLVNFGGGVIGDMGGFAASTFMRGIKFLNIPTTLLAQVDASVGGKLGVDFRGLKNMIGIFNNPEAVLLCPEFFHTLPPEELRSGYAEVLKHALIRDANEFEFLEEQDPLHIPEWTGIVERSVAVKKEVVEKDPFEKGLRKILNFGHTIGHAIESESFQFSEPMLHGEAVAAGMLCESWIAAKLGILPEEDLERIAATIKVAFPYKSLGNLDTAKVLDHMRHDKKNVSGSIRMSLLSAIGTCQENCEVDENMLADSLTFHQSVYATESA